MAFYLFGNGKICVKMSKENGMNWKEEREKWATTMKLEDICPSKQISLDGVDANE